MVKVELALKGLGLLLWGELSVEAILAEDGYLTLVAVDLVLAQQLHDLPTYGRLQRQAGRRAQSGQHSGASWIIISLIA